MATKITILGEEPQKKELKPIEFLYESCFGEYSDEISEAHYKPKDWQNVTLIKRNWRTSGYDLMIAYDHDSNGVVVLGHFNDGIV